MLQPQKWAGGKEELWQAMLLPLAKYSFFGGVSVASQWEVCLCVYFF